MESMGFLMPKLSVESVFDIPFEILIKKGYRAVILDLDNTLLAWNVYEATDEVIHFIQSLKKMGLKICIISNNHEERIKKVADQLQVPYVPFAMKPLKKSYRRALSLLGVKREETISVGDQFYTDIVGGNRMGLFTIMVRPIAAKAYGWTNFIHDLERPLRKRLDKRVAKGKHTLKKEE